MLWSCLVWPSVTLAFSWPAFFGNGVAADQFVAQVQNSTQTRVAIIGAGAAGTSAAFWLSKAAPRLGKDIVIDIYERSEYIGGRSTTVYPYNDPSLRSVELGASIFVDANKNLVRATKHFGHEVIKFDGDESEVGIWDGSSFLVTFGAKSWLGKLWENVRVLWRYGYRSPTTTQALVKSMIDTYLSLYTTVTHWDSIEAVVASLNFTNLVTQSSSAYLASQGVGDAFAFEVVESSTRVNYAQNLDEIHGIEGMVSMAATGAMGVKGGNFKMFESFAKESKANIHTNTHVTSLGPGPGSKWSLQATSSEGKPLSQEYDSVILAARFDTLGISLPSTIAEVKPAPYVRLHVTLLSTTDRSANPIYFNQDAGTTVPSMVLTTLQGARAGGPAPEFNSLSYHGRIAEGRDEWVVKIFSMQEVEDAWLSKVFNNVGWVHRKVWDAYPRLPPTTEFNPMKLDSGLFYVNGFETFISAMETETLASRGVVDLMLREKFGEGICPSGVSDPPAEGEDFVWGWDC